MSPKQGKRKAMTAANVRTRMEAAVKYLEAATMYIEGSDAASWQVAGTNAVLAGIAASDAVCGSVLGYCSQSETHTDALDVLALATSPDREPRKHLAALLSDKSDYHYGTSNVRQQAARDLVRHADRLVTSVRANLK